MRCAFMSATICMLVLLPLSASATQWEYSLNVLPEGWMATPEWGFGNGAQVHLEAHAGSYGESEVFHAYIISAEIVVPESTTETVLEFDHEWDLWGWESEYEGFGSNIEVSYSINSSTQPLLLHYYDNLYSEFNPEGSELFSCTLEVSPGDVLRFMYHAWVTASCWGETTDAAAYLDWHVSDFLLTAYDGQALQPTTWTEIKSFSVEVEEPEERDRATGRVETTR